MSYREEFQKRDSLYLEQRLEAAIAALRAARGPTTIE